jgi:predicted transcriptional regulator
MEPSDIARQLKKYMDENGLKTKFVADKLGISNPSLTEFLVGNRPMPKKIVFKISSFTKNKIKTKEVLREFFKNDEDGQDKIDKVNE